MDRLRSKVTAGNPYYPLEEIDGFSNTWFLFVLATRLKRG